jgi:hypothetical protein
MRLDYFTDLAFVLSAYQCDEIDIFYASLVVMIINTFINFYNYLSIFKRN